MPTPLRRSRLAAVFSLLAAAAGLSCRDAVTGPGAGVRATVPVIPVLTQTAGAPLSFEDITQVRVVLRRLSGELAVDTTVTVPAGGGDLSLAIAVQLNTVPERFNATVDLLGGNGAALFRGGPTQVVGVAVGQEPPEGAGLVTIAYVGPGATTAAALRFDVADTAAFFGDTLVLPATVRDGQGQAIEGVLLAYASLDTTRAVPLGGRRFLLRPVRGPVRIVARTYTGLSDTASVTVQPLPVAVVRAGTAQSAPVATALDAPIAVRVLGADSLGVRGLRVRFATSDSAAGTLADTTVFTDADGWARTQWTMPTRTGAWSATASFPQVAALPAQAFTATATPGAPGALVFTTAPPVTSVAGALAPFTVAVRDTFGNAVPAFADTVALDLALAPDGATLGGPVRVVASGGTATFDGVTLTRAGSGYVLRATAPAAAGATVSSALLTVTAGPAVSVAVTAQAPDTVSAGTAFAVGAAVQDQFGNVADAFAGTLSVTLGTNPNGATLGGTTTRSAVDGAVLFSNLTLDRTGEGTTLVVTASGLTAFANTAAIAVTPGAPAQLAFAAFPSGTVTAGPLPAVAVEVRDAVGNIVTSFADTVSLSLDTLPATGAVLGGPVRVVATNGVASFSGLSVTTTGDGYRLLARTAATGPASFASPTFDVGPDAAVAVTIEAAPPASVASLAPFGLTARVRDQFGNLVPSFAGSVAVTFGANPAGATLGGTTTRSAADGEVVFDALTLDRVGSGVTLVVTAAGVAGAATTTPIAVTAGAATQLVLERQPPATGSVAGSPLDTLVASVRDAAGNIVTSFADTVRLSVSSAAAPNPLLTGTLARVPVGGVVRFDDAVFVPASLDVRLQLTAAGLASAVTDPFEVAPGAPATIVVVGTTSYIVPSGSGVPDTIQVAVRDAQGTGVPDQPVTWEVTGSVGTLSVLDSLTRSDGTVRAVYLPNPIAIESGATLVARTTALPGLTATVSVVTVAGAAARLTVERSPSTSGSISGVPIDTIVVAVRDAAGNVVTGFADTVRLVIDTSSASTTPAIGGTVAQVPVDGLVRYTDIVVTPAADIVRLAAEAAGLERGVTTPFTVAPGAPTTISPIGQTSFTLAAGTPLAEPLVVRVTDALGSPVPGVAISWQVTGTTGTLVVLDSTTTADGTARATYQLATVVGSAELSATAAGVTGQSALYTVVGIAGPATQFAISGPPTTVARGEDFQVLVGLRDQFGNVVLNHPDSLVVTFQQNPGAATLEGTTRVLVTTPEATLTLRIGEAGDGYRLRFTAGTVVDSSDAFTVLGAGLREWTGALSDDWTVAANWSPAAVPAPDDTVRIRGAAFAAYLRTRATIAALRVDPGASFFIDGDTLVVTRDIQSDGAIAGPIVASGPSSIGVRGNVGPLVVRQSVSLFGQTNVAGALVIDTASSVPVLVSLASQRLQVAGDLRTGGTAGFALLGAADTLEVLGDAELAGSGTSILAGTFRLQGNLLVTATGTFAPSPLSGDFRTELFGGSDQVITIQPNPAVHGFQHLTISKPIAATVQLAGRQHVFGDITLSGGTLTAGDSLTLYGSVIGSGGLWQMPSTVVALRSLSSPTSRSLASSLAAAEWLVPDGAQAELGAAGLTGPMRVNGQLLVSGVVSVDGDLTVAGAAATLFATETGDLTVTGAAEFAGANAGGDAGTFRFRGDFRQLASAPAAYRASSGHLTLFDGTAAQQVSMSTPAFGTDGSRFGTVRFANPAGVELASRVLLDEAFVLAGQVTFGAAADTVYLRSLVIESPLDPATAWVPGAGTTAIRTNGGGVAQLPSLLPGRLLVAEGSTPSFVTQTLVRGPVQVRGDLTLADLARLSTDSTLVVGDTLEAEPSGRVNFEGASELSARGAVVFRTVLQSSPATGTLRVGGDFRQDTIAGRTTSWAAYQAVAGHQTVFDGPGLQTVLMTSPQGQGPWGSGGSRLGDVEVLNSSIALDVATPLAVTSLALPDVETGLQFRAGADTLSLYGAFTRARAFQVNLTGRVLKLLGPGAPASALPDTILGSVRLAMGGAYQLPSSVVVTEDVVTEVPVSFAGRTLRVNGAFRYADGGALVMAEAADSLDVGRLILDGTPGTSTLVGGRVVVRDSVAILAAGAYPANALHQTILAGTAEQPVAMNFASSSGNRFGELKVRTQGAPARINTSVVALGPVALFPSAQLAYGTAPLTVSLHRGIADSSGETSVLQAMTADQRYVIAGNASDALAIELPLNGNVVDSTDVAFTRSLVVSGNWTQQGLAAKSIGGNTIIVSGDYTQLSGALGFTSAQSVLDVAGSFITSTSTTNTGSAGVLRVGRDLVQQAAVATLQFGDGHLTELAGTSTQRVRIRGAALTQNYLGALEVAGGASVVLDSSVATAGRVRVRPNGQVNAALTPGIRLIVEDSIVVDSAAILNLSASAGGLIEHRPTGIQPADTVFSINSEGFLVADTVAFYGPARTLPLNQPGWSRRHIRVTDIDGQLPARLPAGTTNLLGRDLVVVGAAQSTLLQTAVAGSQLVNVGNLRVEGAGRLFMTNAADTIDVNGATVFAGTEASDFAAGTLLLRGNVTYSSTALNSATPEHVTWLLGSGAQQITGTGNRALTTARFGTLNVPAAAAGSADVFTGGLVAHRVNLIGTGRLFDATSSGALHLLETLGAGFNADLAFTAGSGFSVVLASGTAAVRDSSVTFRPDTLVVGAAGVSFTNNGGFGSYTLRHLAVRGTTPGTASFANSNLFLQGDVLIDGALQFLVDGTDNLLANGNLRTAGNGTLAMAGGAVLEANDAIFAGAPSGPGPTMSGGFLRVRGNFVQEGDPRAFRAAPGHRTVFTSNAAHRVFFQNPDTLNGSFFGDMEMGFTSPSALLALDSDVHAQGGLEFSRTSALETARVQSNVGRVTMTAYRSGIGFDDGFTGLPFEFSEVGLDSRSLQGEFLQPNASLNFVGAFGDGRPILSYAHEGILDFNFNRFRFDGVTDAEPVFLACRSTGPTGLSMNVWFEAPGLPFGAAIDDPRIVREPIEGFPRCVVNNIVP